MIKIIKNSVGIFISNLETYKIKQELGGVN